LVPNPRASGLIALLCFLHDIFLFALQSRNYYYFIPIVFSCCLEKLLQVLFGDYRKRTSSGCFSFLVILNLSLRTGLILPHMLGLVSVVLLLKHDFILFFKKKKMGEKMQNFIFFLSIALQILYVLLPDISVYCALIDYAYI
jgi:hypothetical protein